MSVNSKDFLAFAKVLPNNEINNRNAVSRAYYAAYHKCIEFYGAEFTFTVKGGVHEQIIQYLGNSCDKKERAIAFQLLAMKNLRVLADYKLDNDLNERDRVEAVKYADKIFNSLNE